MLSFDLNSKNQPIIAYMIQNRLDLINQKNKTIRIKRKLFYNPKEPNIVSKKDGDNWSFRASYDPISFDICLDNQDRTYVLTNHKTTQKEIKEENKIEMILEIFDKDYKIIEIVPIYDYTSNCLYINKENKIYLFDSDKRQVIRFKSLF